MQCDLMQFVKAYFLRHMRPISSIIRPIPNATATMITMEKAGNKKCGNRTIFVFYIIIIYHTLSQYVPEIQDK